MNNLIIKATHQGDNRRVSFERNPTYEELYGTLKGLFKIDSFNITYTDEDGDQITLSSEMEMKEAISMISNNQPRLLRLTVTKPSSPSVEKPTTSTTNSTSDANSTQTPNLHCLVSSILGPDMFKNLMNPCAVNNNNNNNVDQTKLQSDISSVFQSLNDPAWINSLVQSTLESLKGLNTGVATPSTTTSTTSTTSTAPAAAAATTSTDENNNNNNNSNKVEHPGVVCDSCNLGIFGVRHKCSICPNYDLCETCKEKGDAVHPTSHPMFSITAPIGTGCPRFGGWGGYGQHHGGYGGQHYGGQHHGGQQHYGGWGHGGFGRRWGCQKNKYLSRYVQDMTVKDGSVFSPNSSFTKIWRLRNDGREQWPANTTLTWVSGDRMSSPEGVTVEPALPGSDVDVAINLVAPSTPGRYIGYWKLFTPDGNAFGQRLFTDIFVVEDLKKEEPKETLVVEKKEEVKEPVIEKKEEQPAKPAVEQPSIEEIDDEKPLYDFVAIGSPISSQVPLVSQVPAPLLFPQVPTAPPAAVFSEPVVIAPVPEPVVVVPEPEVAPVQVDDNKRQCIIQLIAMGFGSHPNLAEIVKKYNYQVEEIVEHLLSN